MKTQINNQETSKGQVYKMTFRASVVLVSALLISFSVNAQDFWEQFSNSIYDAKMTMNIDGQLAETKNADIAVNAINSELKHQLNYSNEFNAEDESFFQDAEQYTVEGVDQEIAKYVEKISMNEGKEEAMVIESWMTDESFFQDAEQYTTEGADQEIEKYTEKIIFNEENENTLTQTTPTNNFYTISLQ